jgi:3-deoxy-D-manno-octulosonic acid kinase
MNSVVATTTEESHILYDAGLVDQSGDPLFEPDAWRARGELGIAAAGRGTTFFVHRPQGDWVLRHYCRGGLVARLSRDRYLWWGLEVTRPWREWRLLAALHELELPVPRPVAARVQRHGLLYSGDLITERLPAKPVSSLASTSARVPWGEIGSCIRRFHDVGVYHADLNAHNILVDEEQKPFLIDFDRGRLRSEGPWKGQNLQRLRRSLDKLKAQRTGFAFDGGDWADLMAGYGGL